MFSTEKDTVPWVSKLLLLSSLPIFEQDLYPLPFMDSWIAFPNDTVTIHMHDKSRSYKLSEFDKTN